MSASSAVDSAYAVFALQAHLARFDANTVARGQAYFRGGRVTDLQPLNATAFTAIVRGSQQYQVVLARDGASWTGSCTCPIGVACKHVVAAALQWIALLQEMPDGLPAAARPNAVTAAAPGGLAEWEKVFAEKLGRPLAKDEHAFAGALWRLFQNVRNAGAVWPVDLERLGLSHRDLRRAPQDPAFAGRWTMPPRDPWELWQYLAWELEESGRPVPAFMRPLTDTAAVRKVMQHRQRRDAIRRWSERFERLDALAGVPPAGGRPEFPPGFELRLWLGHDRWAVETRTSPEAPWKAAPRTLIERATRDSDGGLAFLEAAPAVFAFFAVCREHFRRTYSIAFTPHGANSRELLHRLLLHRLARTLVVGPGGQPLVFADAPVVWNVTRPAESAADYEVALQLPNGEPLPPAALHLPGTPPLYLLNDVVYRGPPALDGASAAAAIVPAEVVERAGVLRTLRQFGARLPAEIEQRFVVVPLLPRVTCALDGDPSGSEVLVLELHAHAVDPPVLCERLGTGWTEVSAPPEASRPSGQILTFDFAAANAMASRLGELRVVFDSYRRCWTRRVTKTFPEEFVAWRESLPPGVEVRATGELASLLGGPVRARVDIDLSETKAHRDWFDLALVLRPEDTTFTPAEIALLLRARGKLVRLPGKGWRRLSVEIDAAQSAAIAAAGLDVATLGDGALAGEKHRFHALQLAQTSMAGLLPEKLAAALRERARTLARPVAPDTPDGLRATLRPYQREGFEFLAFLSANRLGGVLADDMGLGKTLQALTWLLWLAARQPPEAPLRALVVCPKSVVGNWENETARFAPALAVERFVPQESEARYDAMGARPLLVAANYTQLRLNEDFFRGRKWHAVILDEAQFIKNPGSKVAQVAREIPGEHRVVLTGTPIENRLLDLWSLFAFALPGLLGSQTAFKRHHSEDDPLALARLRKRVRHFLLRRTKAQVASDLPPRTEEDVLVELEGEQARLYQAELKRARAQLLQIDTPRQLDRARFNILASLMRLRQICCHPALVDDAHRGASSAKLDELLDRVEELRAEGHQVLVFSQFVEMLHLIANRLTTVGIEHLLLTGQTENRDELVAQFQSDRTRTVFLLSLKAAGFGLNLTAASYAILFDPWWNPAVEAQAIDRTHRIGQTVPVNAYRLIARGTVEEKIRALQREKAALAGAIVQEESLASVLDLDSLRQILG
jgi:superfamily II DNA or RNA helicase